VFITQVFTNSTPEIYPHYSVVHNSLLIFDSKKAAKNDFSFFTASYVLSGSPILSY